MIEVCRADTVWKPTADKVGCTPKQAYLKWKNLWSTCTVFSSFAFECLVLAATLFSQKFDNPLTGSKGGRSKPTGYDMVGEIMPKELPRRARNTGVEAGLVHY